jgi:excisionase family DNA binding protein
MEDRILTAADVAAMLQVSEEVVRRWLYRGELRGFLPGGKRLGYRVRLSEVERFISEREGKADRPAAALTAARA